MRPFTQVLDGETFLTYAASEEAARAAFIAEGLPGSEDEPARVRAQPARKASAFRYTRDGATVAATVVGEVPPEFRDDETPAPDSHDAVTVAD